MIYLDGGDRRASPGSKFERDASGSGKKIQNGSFFKIYPVVQYIEQILPGKIGCRPGLEIFSGFKEPAFKFPTYYSHL